MSRCPTAAEMIEIQAAFEACGFGDVQVVDKLRDVTLDSLEDGNLHFVGTCFAEDSESVGSFRVSFHCLLNPEGKMSSAYAYDIRTGNEIAFAAA